MTADVPGCGGTRQSQYKALKNQMADIYEELKRLESCSSDNDELLYTLQVIAITLNGLKGED